MNLYGLTALAQGASNGLAAYQEGQLRGQQTVFGRFVQQRAMEEQQRQADDKHDLATAQLRKLGVVRGPARAPVLGATVLDPASGGNPMAPGASWAHLPDTPGDTDLGGGLAYRPGLDENAVKLAGNMERDNNKGTIGQALEKLRQGGRMEVVDTKEAGAKDRAESGNTTKRYVADRRYAGQVYSADHHGPRAGVAGGADPERRREGYLLRRVPQLMQPRRDPARRWVTTPGLSREDAVAAAQAEYESVIGAGDARLGAGRDAGAPAPPVVPTGPAPGVSSGSIADALARRRVARAASPGAGGTRPAITVDQATFLRERKGLTDAQIHARYEVH